MKKILLILLTCIIGLTPIFTQEKLYILKDIVYDIDGYTIPSFLERRLDITRGVTFTSIQDIEDYTLDLSQELENLRIYENLSVSYEILGTSVIIKITLDEAWGIIPFPYPKFNTETGGRLALKLFWYNTLGTLTNSLVQGGVDIGFDNGSSDLSILTWNAQMKVEELLLFNRYFDITLDQSLERDSKDDYEWKYFETKLSFGTSFKLFDYKYSPKLSIATQYDYNSANDDTELEDFIEYKTPLKISYSHGFGYNNIDWIGNFRDGYSYGISNTITFQESELDGFEPTTSFSVSGDFYKTFGNLPIAIGTQLIGKLSVNDELLGLGSNVRGVESGDLYGTMGIFSNNNIFIRVIKVKGYAEAIFAPHFDLGITDNKDLKYGAGADFILYVDKLKSLVARGSISWDLEDFNLEDFQIDITSSLFF